TSPRPRSPPSSARPASSSSPSACASSRARWRRPTSCTPCARTSRASKPSAARKPKRPPPPDPMSSPASSARNQRKTILGFVSSRSGDKSVKLTVAYKTPHPLYHKVINRKTVVHAHDEKNETKVGDRVELMETRPLSRLKRWRVTAVVERAVGDTGQA